MNKLPDNDVPLEAGPRPGPRACVVQGSLQPVFKGAGSGDFNCRGCGHLLVTGHEPRRLVGLDIRCFKCQEVTRTEPWPSNEPLPSKLVTLGYGGAFRVCGTVNLTAEGNGFTCSDEIDRVRALTGIQPPSRRRLEVFHARGLDQVEAELSSLCAHYQACAATTKRAHEMGNDGFRKYPLPWAMSRLRQAVKVERFDFDGPDGVALVFVQLSLTLSDRWKHHPNFLQMTAGLTHQFHHTITQFAIANHLADHGNSIGFMQPPLDGGRSPDLFLNRGATTRIGIEVKAPTSLQWPNVVPSSDKLRKVIKEQLADASGQIDKRVGGLIALGTSVSAPDVVEKVQSAIQSLIKSGKVPSHVAGVACACIASHPEATDSGDQILTRIPVEYVVELNPHFAGEQIVTTNIN